jgi:hypothetical protein
MGFQRLWVDSRRDSRVIWVFHSKSGVAAPARVRQIRTPTLVFHPKPVDAPAGVHLIRALVALPPSKTFSGLSVMPQVMVATTYEPRPL